MPITTSNDFVLYDDEFHTAQTETLQQETEVFNGMSNGAINLVPLSTVGNFRKRTMFLNRAHITHRDPVSTAVATPTAMAQAELVSAKMHKRYQVETTKQAYKDIGSDMGLFSSTFGVQSSKEKMAKYLNSGLIALRSMMQVANGGAAAAGPIRHDAPGDINHIALNNAMAKLGDKSNRIVAFVTHSAHLHKLIESSINDDIYDIGGHSIRTGNAITFNRPIIVTDSPALEDAANPGRYFLFGLTAGALNLLETQEDDVFTETVGGHENLMYRIQGEFGFNAEAKGCSYIGPANPDDATLAAPANFSFISTDIKDGPGVWLSAAG